MKRKNAFTLAETLVTLCVIAVIVTLTAITTVNSDNTKLKKTFSLTQSFYTDIVSTYQGVLLTNVKSGNIQNITVEEDEDEDDDEEDESNNPSPESVALKKLFAPYLDGDDIDCSNLKTSDDESKAFKEDNGALSCIVTSRGIVAGFYLDTACNATYQISEYLQLDANERNNRRLVENACGYILYASRTAKGIYGTDVFTIALGKRDVK